MKRSIWTLFLFTFFVYEGFSQINLFPSPTEYSRDGVNVGKVRLVLISAPEWATILCSMEVMRQAVHGMDITQ
ncbi:MAG: hypothetical protein LBC19_06930 [Tannerella sp.]|nr:hypothetical protein [Tannerella sp.]